MDNMLVKTPQEFTELFMRPRRSLALYPECAVLQELEFRTTCCDTKVKSAAGREFCYNDIIYPEKTFEDCYHDGDETKTFECCDELAGANLSKGYSCKEELLPRLEKARCFNTESACE